MRAISRSRKLAGPGKMRCWDSFAARFAINAASRALGIPLVSGALGRFDLQLGVFNLSGASPCYRCFVHEAPEIEQDCATHGVLGAMAGMGGSMVIFINLCRRAILCALRAKFILGPHLNGRRRKSLIIRESGRK